MLAEIDLLLARQRQQQVDRPLIPVEIEHELYRLAGAPVSSALPGDRQHEVDQRLHRHADQPGRRLRLTPIWPPTHGSTNSNTSRISMP